MQSRGLSEANMAEIQDHLDAIVAVSNDKTKNVTVEVVDSVDSERKQRRKDKKDKKEKKDEHVVEPAVEPVKAARKTTKKSSD